MSSFEFIAVLLSIIFGLAIANLLSGVLEAFLRRELTDTRVAWSILVGNILLLDWWLFWQWSDHTDWRFYEFLYLVVWATVHYLLAVSLFPYKFLTDYSEKLQQRFVLVALIVVAALDVGEKVVLGRLFDPWYYLLIILFLLSFALLPLLITKSWAMRLSGWVLAAGTLSWSVFVRDLLAR
jgi:hypothetical protein